MLQVTHADLIGPAVTVIMGAIGVIVWLVRLEGRVNTEHSLRAALNDRLDSFESRIYSTLERIENKISNKADRSDWTPR